VADARVVRARHWIEYVRLLASSATQDLDAIKESIEDSSRELGTKTQAARESLARSQIARARFRLSAAYVKQREIRSLLLLDEEPEGQP
jgi:hypothetical protein